MELGDDKNSRPEDVAEAPDSILTDFGVRDEKIRNPKSEIRNRPWATISPAVPERVRFAPFPETAYEGTLSKVDGDDPRYGGVDGPSGPGDGGA